MADEVGFCKKCGSLTEVAVLPQDRLQARVVAAVEKRGYMKDWMPGQFLARQVAKLVEELGELAAEMRGVLPVELQSRMQDAADSGRWYFDTGYWHNGLWGSDQMERIWKELVDMQVVLACAAGALEKVGRPGCDLMQGAVEKAEKDVERGVR